MSCGLPARLSAVLAMISRCNAVVHVVLGPKHGARRDTVHADLGPELARQRAGEHREAGFGDAVHRVPLQGPQAMNVDHVDDEPALPGEVRRRGLRQKQGRAQIAADQIVPRRLGDLADGCRIESRGIVDEHVEPAEMLEGGADQLLGRLVSMRSAANERRRIPRARRFSSSTELSRRRGGGAVVQEDARAGRMQRPRDLGADAPRAARDQDHLVVERVSRCWPPCAVKIPDCARSVYRRAERRARDARGRARRSELAHVERVRERIAAEIDAAGGWIGFDRYMDLALYAPGLGLLQRRGAQARARRRLHHGAGSLATVRRLRGAAVRRDPARAGPRQHPRDRRGQRPFGGRCPVAAGWRSVVCPSATSCSRSARICASGSAAASPRPCRTSRGASNGWTRRPTWPSTASCSPTRCSMRCR